MVFNMYKLSPLQLRSGLKTSDFALRLSSGLRPKE